MGGFSEKDLAKLKQMQDQLPMTEDEKRERKEHQIRQAWELLIGETERLNWYLKHIGDRDPATDKPIQPSKAEEERWKTELERLRMLLDELEDTGNIASEQMLRELVERREKQEPIVPKGIISQSVGADGARLARRYLYIRLLPQRLYDKDILWVEIEKEIKKRDTGQKLSLAKWREGGGTSAAEYFKIGHEHRKRLLKEIADSGDHGKYLIEDHDKAVAAYNEAEGHHADSVKYGGMIDHAREQEYAILELMQDELTKKPWLKGVIQEYFDRYGLKAFQKSNPSRAGTPE